jgi:hypothetical protein
MCNGQKLVPSRTTMRDDGKANDDRKCCDHGWIVHRSSRISVKSVVIVVGFDSIRFNSMEKKTWCEEAKLLQEGEKLEKACLWQYCHVYRYKVCSSIRTTFTKYYQLNDAVMLFFLASRSAVHICSLRSSLKIVNREQRTRRTNIDWQVEVARCHSFFPILP